MHLNTNKNKNLLNVPDKKSMRDKIRLLAAKYVKRKQLTGPVNLDQLRKLSTQLMQENNIDKAYLDFTAVIMNNEIWRPVVSAVPYEKRLILLPKCLRDSQNCTAGFDEIGLLCKDCRKCPISPIRAHAAQLGSVVLVAEGSPVVLSLIETGQIQAVIGVSCMNVLEKTFPYMEAGAIPGIAIPLLYDGCRDTAFDTDWLLDALYEISLSGQSRIDLAITKQKVQSLFTIPKLARIFNDHEDPTAAIAIEWMAQNGKRYRPFITACVYQVLKNSEKFDGNLITAAVAVECFHKASLIHDDIEDHDRCRYSQSTLHIRYNLPIALNVGDYLIGQGYKLLASLKIPPDIKSRLLAAAADCHKNLCKGQGKELLLIKQKNLPTVEQLIDIFRDKTAPAFEFALKAGSLIACDLTLEQVFEKYSTPLGIAYQIQDDINDFSHKKWKNHTPQLSIIEALAAAPDCKTPSAATAEAIKMMDQYKTKTVDAIAPLKNPQLKSLLRRIISKVFNEIEILNCCHDYTNPND